MAKKGLVGFRNCPDWGEFDVSRYIYPGKIRRRTAGRRHMGGEEQGASPFTLQVTNSLQRASRIHAKY
jgi:hypothetical protein